MKTPDDVKKLNSLIKKRDAWKKKIKALNMQISMLQYEIGKRLKEEQPPWDDDDVPF